MARAVYGGGHLVFYFGGGIVGEGVAEILDDVETVSTANHAQPDHVVGRVEQVGAVRGRKHEMLVAVWGVVIEGDVFSFLIELEVGAVGQPNGEGGLAFKFMGKLARFEHGLSVNARGFGESGIELQRGGSGLLAGLIGQG